MSILFCTGIQSGELKHGPLALVDETVPIIMIIMRDNVHSKCMNALQQVTARKGRPIIVCEQGDVVSYLKILSLISVNSKNNSKGKDIYSYWRKQYNEYKGVSNEQ